MLRKRKKRSLNREVPHLRDTNIIFIGIEGGSATSSREARYFDIFRELDIRFHFKVIPCHEDKSSPDQVLEHLKKEIENEPLKEGDEKWLVVDVDRYEKQLRVVAQQCMDANIQLAVSNPCFEYWLLLHYSDPDEQSESCKSVKSELIPKMDKDSKKHDGYSVMFFDNAPSAIERAKKRDDIKQRWPDKNGSRVYKIIERFFEM